MKTIRRYLLLTILVGFFGNFYGQVGTASLSKSNATACDTVIATFSGIHCCGNSVPIGTAISISGSTITIDYSSTCPSICLPSIVYWNATQNIGGLGPGTYTVQFSYNNTVNSSLNTTLTVGGVVANAGSDTSVCNLSSIQLNGNTPGAGASGGWKVITGSGTLNNPALPNATVSNLSFGLNEFEWAISDSGCTTIDLIKVTNYELPSNAVTEADRFSCYDTTTINATAPATGMGTWSSPTSGVFILNKNQATSKTLNLQQGQNIFAWKVENGVCPVNRDTLLIEHNAVTDTPVVSINANALLSSLAPSYQWYFNGNPINGATNQSHNPTSNGLYKVFTHYPGCDNGLFSNEIDWIFQGLSENLRGSDFLLYPNPASDHLNITSTENQLSKIVVKDMSGKVVIEDFKSNGSTYTLDVSRLAPGMYLYQIVDSKGQVVNGKVMID